MSRSLFSIHQDDLDVSFLAAEAQDPVARPLCSGGDSADVHEDTTTHVAHVCSVSMSVYQDISFQATTNPGEEVVSCADAQTLVHPAGRAMEQMCRQPPEFQPQIGW